MNLDTKTKQEVIDDFKLSEDDTGSANVQVALLTSRIKHLAKHFKIHKKDLHSRKGLLRLVSKRKKLLAYLKNKDNKHYAELISRLGLRK